MHWRVILTCLLIVLANGQLSGFEKIKSYARFLSLKNFKGYDASHGNELWRGLLRDCANQSSFSCIQKNVYSYLDDTFEDRDNMTVFGGLVLTRNNLDYEACANSAKSLPDDDALSENLVEEKHEAREEGRSFAEEEGGRASEVEAEDEPASPLEEVTSALRGKAIKFLATRDYEIQLPEFFFEGSTVKISPREVDESGALVRLDFGQRGLSNEPRIFKKIKKFIQNKLLMSFLALLLIIKLIKVKFMFIIPFLFGIGTAKKLFLKLLLFFIPAFAHIFKLCSSYYTVQGTKYHHHHHQIAHHHHHVPVPVPVPAYHNHHDHPYHEEDFDGYDYAHPHIQYRKDMEELKEWGIEPYEDPYEETPGQQHHPPGVLPAPVPVPGRAPGHDSSHGAVPNPWSSSLRGSSASAYSASTYGIGQYAANAKPVRFSVYPTDKNLPAGVQAQNLAYAGYAPDSRLDIARRVVMQQLRTAGSPSPGVAPTISNPIFLQSTPSSMNTPFAEAHLRPNSYQSPVHSQNAAHVQSVPQSIPQQQQQHFAPPAGLRADQHRNAAQRRAEGVLSSSSSRSNGSTTYDDEFYGGILGRLDETFRQLKFVDEGCRERLVCSMYRNPSLYSPHSNLVSNELSRNPEELKRGVESSSSGQRFMRYLAAARFGQDGGDCSASYPCHIGSAQ
ncbi:uncharacterized protein LOC107263012 [Cephus cinctus]|uniref:Uncharacterized protein LOC107263012 n=1 Tax=Cephus cinctus TaxID=211228 RepID=A0AAJ7BGQ9_CEPCN|nr:uncharacterized protein LOC107263012 [Cephus cinctus]